MTTVEFLLRQFALLGYDVHKYETIINEAKEMEKEQIINATLYGFRQDSDGDDWEGDNYNAEQYYNKTFKQQEQLNSYEIHSNSSYVKTKITFKQQEQ
jgi:hypothetical protein